MNSVMQHDPEQSAPLRERLEELEKAIQPVLAAANQRREAMAAGDGVGVAQAGMALERAITRLENVVASGEAALHHAHAADKVQGIMRYRQAANDARAYGDTVT